MGNSSDKIVLLKEQLSTKKILIERKYYTVYEDEKDSKQYEYWLQKSKVNSFSAQEQFLSDLRSQKDSSLVSIRNFSLGQIKEWFTTEYLFAALIDHPKYNLIEFLTKKDIKMQQYQIYLMTSQLLGAEVLLDKNSQFLGLNNIFSNDENGLKWCLKPLRAGDLIIQPNQKMYHIDQDNVIIGFPPPEYKVGEYDKESTKIFTLGMILLQMILNESNSDIYNEQQQFQINVFENKIEKLKQADNCVSKELIEFVLIMLSLEPRNRTTFKNLTLKLLSLISGLPKGEKERLQNYLSLRNSKESVQVLYNGMISVPLQEQEFKIKFNQIQQNPNPEPEIQQKQDPPTQMLQSPTFVKKIIQEVYSGTTYQNLYNGKGKLERKFSVEHIEVTIDPNNLSLAEDLIKIYDGEFKLSKKHGFGKITYLNGDTFEGYFEDGRINGQGVFISKDTCKKGIWKNDLLVGEQNLNQTLDNIGLNYFSFNDSWKSKQQEIQKNTSSPSPIKEEQIFQGLDNTKTGKGKLLTKQNQLIYEGNFVNGLFDGHGTLYNLQAVATKQIDSKNLNSALIQNYWNQYSGKFQQGKKNGEGTIYFTDKSVFTGEFQDDKITGKGSYSQQNSFVIKGQFNDGSKLNE